MEMAAEKVVLLFLAAVGISLLVAMLVLVVIVSATIFPGLLTLLRPFERRIRRSMKHSSEFKELGKEGSYRP